MSCEPEIASVLQARGLRRTTQRARILATLRHAASGLTAAEHVDAHRSARIDAHLCVIGFAEKH